MFCLKLNNDNIIKSKIPVIEAYINVTSEDSSNFNKYSLYILKLVSKEKKIDYIEEVTKFKKEQIESELEILKSYGLIKKERENYEITQIGYQLVNQINEINQFNKKKIKVLIDKSTGLIIEYKDNYEKISKETYRFVKDTYNNLNPVNSKKFFKEHYESLFKNSDIEYIDIEIKLSQEEYWIERYITNITSLLDYEKSVCYLSSPKIGIQEDEVSEADLLLEEENMGISSRQISGIICKVKFELQDLSLNKYRKVKEELYNLSVENNELLSEYAIQIIEKFNFEDKLNKEIEREIYFDSISGCITFEHSDVNIKKYQNLINVEPIIDFNNLTDKCKFDILKICFKDILKDIDNNDYKLKCEIQELKVVKEVPYEILYRGV